MLSKASLTLLIPPLPLPHICESQPSPTVTGLTITSHQIVVGLLQLALKWQQTISKQATVSAAVWSRYCSTLPLFCHSRNYSTRLVKQLNSSRWLWTFQWSKVFFAHSSRTVQVQTLLKRSLFGFTDSKDPKDFNLLFDFLAHFLMEFAVQLVHTLTN